ncbi:coiled-coil domain-containing protein 60-like [Leptonychotes weddellii]|uniref:Coiled-coil domain-containing protein 60-like n=1 Tax=Leptonychotes weddellii TaxID=9713 RepID=A0A7F8RAP1_LEPWE|nr:coiled-coil domain-containing protein 60-like [Leptonychotes weddellii]
MGQRWEHFVTAPKTKKFKIPVLRVTSRKPSRRGSTLSLSRTSGGSSPQSSMVSMNPGSDEPPSVITQGTGSKDIEDNESSSTKPEEEPLHIIFYIWKFYHSVTPPPTPTPEPPVWNKLFQWFTICGTQVLQKIR